MIKELAWRIQLDGIWQAAHTAGVVIPIGWYFLNPKKLYLARLLHNRRKQVARAVELFALPKSTSTQGSREMKPHDVPEVTRPLKEYLSQFTIAPILDEKDVEHLLLPKEDVMDSYVVESPETHENHRLLQLFHSASFCTGESTY
ncbi:LOW QUALITY PROTEIN: Myristoyl-CoA:protein N-myristoyltransferase [Trema orientale]|uniref:Glycylpeptide N-tetradecanoyltransferase n=1 Tax=Trema orientale TaxID=63057 RepID=A0A2P5FEG7_TREOI|nr:LOW QUALITY PROTEIN: Myristoyl-CoA:protein N-myristoyltransferase [Trema orientale]